MVSVVWLSWHQPEIIGRGYWDQGMLEAALDGSLAAVTRPFEFTHLTELSAVPPGQGAVVVVPARHHAADIDRLNAELAALPWVVLFLTGDEAHTFPVELLSHPELRTWVMTPDPVRHDGPRVMLTGWPPQAREELAGATGEALTRPLDWFFAGQATNQRRLDCLDQLGLLHGGEAHPSRGFTQGLDPHVYYRKLAGSKVAPCPSGPVSVDTFRVAEALEAGCLPIADGRTPHRGERSFWTLVFGEEPPFPVVEDWEALPGLVPALLADWPANANQAFAWWQLYKRRLARAIHEDVAAHVSRPAPTLDDLVTVLIPTSPIPGHPDTSIIEQTIGSVRHHFPAAEVLVMIDGVRDEQDHRSAAYVEYTRRLLWLTNRWPNVTPLLFTAHHHQAAMARRALDLVDTPTVLFVEHDTPLVTDCPIEWPELVEAVTAGYADVVRLHHEALVLDEHQHLMIDKEALYPTGAPMLRTAQWSQRPHLASAVYYRDILDRHFGPDDRTMIEDVMHGVTEAAWRDGLLGWCRHRLWLYAPQDGNMKRSAHLDGRGGDPKYAMWHAGRWFE